MGKDHSRCGHHSSVIGKRPNMKKPNELSAAQALRAIEDGSLSCEALMRSCLERIEQRNLEIKAFTAINPARSIAQAQAVDQGAAAPLRGLPIAVKDVLDTAEFATEYGSPIYEGHRPVADAACVSRAKEHGALVIGKVATSEFATQSPSQTRNPLNLAHTPGGSSSGSAAAVADFMTPIAFGTQTTASTVRPASYCGVVGFKPTFGFFNVSGLKPLSPSQDTISVITRTVEDAALCSFGIHGMRQATQILERPRIALCLSSQWDNVNPEMVHAIETLAAHAQRQGAQVHSVRLSAEMESLISMQGRLFAFEARQSLAYERQLHAGLFSPRLTDRLAGGKDVTAVEYLEMRQRANAARQTLNSLFADADVLLYPPAQGEADEGIVDSGSAQFGALWSLMHVPCVSVPIALGSRNLPMGTQVIGNYGDDLRTLQAAAFISRVAASNGYIGHMS